MKLEPPYLIDDRKLTHYLLVSLPKDDKSKYLRLAGYQLDNWPTLKKDLFTLVDNSDAAFEGVTVFGYSYSVIGTITGPNGRSLVVKTIWMQENKTGFTKFITLYPP